GFVIDADGEAIELAVTGRARHVLRGDGCRERGEFGRFGARCVGGLDGPGFLRKRARRLRLRNNKLLLGVKVLIQLVLQNTRVKGGGVRQCTSKKSHSRES